jgi:hypothetical protein
VDTKEGAEAKLAPWHADLDATLAVLETLGASRMMPPSTMAAATSPVLSR